MNEIIADQIIEGIRHCDNETKQKLGQTLAEHLRLKPGNAGPDGGVDGFVRCEEGLVVFQSKLNKEKIGAEMADAFFSMMLRNSASIGIYLSLFGFTDEFKKRILDLQQSSSLNKAPSVFLLSIKDVLTKSNTFLKAIAILPELRETQKVIT